MTERGNPGLEVIRSVSRATRTMNLKRQAVRPFLPAEHTLLMKVNGHGKGIVSNQFGFYSITLERGNYPVMVSFTGYLPIQTLVGNHETYGTLAMQAYYDHYILDEMSYQGITSGTENYYANQVVKTLFIAMDIEHTGIEQ